MGSDAAEPVQILRGDEMAVFFLRHTPISKATQRQPYTAWAHFRYIMRESACTNLHTEHMPNGYWEKKPWIYELEDKARKNARLVDKLVLNLPRELDSVTNLAMVIKYLKAIGKGRIPAIIAIHGKYAEHPHAHLTFIDRDIETRKRVFGTSDKGSTHRLRAMWEDIVNQHLREHGFSQPISRYGKNHQKSRQERSTALTQPEASVTGEYKQGNNRNQFLARNATKSIQVQIETPRQLTQDEIVLPPPREKPVAEIIQLPGGTGITATLIKLQLLQDELGRLVEARQRVADFHAQKETNHAHLTRNGTRKREIQDQLDVAMKSYHKAQKDLQKHKGILSNTLSFLGIKTKARKAAEAAYVGAQQQVERFATLAERLNEEHELLQNADNKHHGEMQEAIKQLERWGTLPEIDTAETLLRNSIFAYAKDLNVDRVREAYQRQEITEKECDAALHAITRHTPKRETDISH